MGLLDTINPRAINRERKPARIEFKILTPTEGDRRHIWNPADPADVAAAAARFNELIGQGYKAFRVGRGGRRDDRVTSFDPTAGEYLFTGARGLVGG